MKSLLIIAHGSRRAESNDEIRELSEKVTARAGGQYEHIACAFLELAEPSIPAAIQALVDKGVQNLVVLPYFLANGMHVARDIPEQIAKATSQNPEVNVTISPYIGALDIMPLLILDSTSTSD